MNREYIENLVIAIPHEDLLRYPIYRMIDHLGVETPFRIVGNVIENGVPNYVCVVDDNNRTVIYLPHPPPVAGFDEARLSDRSRARRNARISRRSDRRVARQAFEQQQRQLQPALFANPHNIFQQQRYLPLIQRPLSPVHQQPPNPESSRQRRRASRMSRERREELIRQGLILGGKTRRRMRRH
jgi:hypothetical protein